jgi:hypothetical protein
MKLFRKKVNAPLNDKAVSLIVSGLLRVQRRWAKGMSNLFKHLTIQQQKALIVFSVLAGLVYSCFIVYDGFTHKRSAFSVNSIRAPTHVVENGDAASSKRLIVPDKVMKDIIRFRNYLDSLSRSAAGKLIADSILKRRPGLPDSIQQLEEIYHLQK